MKTQYYTASSLDGFIATEDHSLDWLFQLGDINQTGYPRFILEVGALAMGSATYEWMLRHVVKLGAEPEAPWPYQQPVWVFTSRDLHAVAGADIRFVRGDVRPVHERMCAAARGRNIWLVGGGDLVGQFYDAGLLDELIVQVGSVTLGAGKPLLPRRIAFPPLRLTSVHRIGNGFAELRYEVPRPNSGPGQSKSRATRSSGSGRQSFIVDLWGVRYQVEDVSRSVAFYTEHLGFKLDHQKLPAFAQVSIGNLKLILSGPGASGSRPMPDGRRQEPGGWNRVVLKVDDLPARIEALKKAGLRFRNEMEAGPGGRQVQIEDPDGNPIELFEPAR